MNFEYLLNHKNLFPSIIGITYYQFSCLLPKFSKHLRIAEKSKALSKSNRLRNPGGGRKSKFNSDASKLFFILFYYKTYPTYRLAQVVFELDIHNLFYWKAFLEPVLHDSVSYQLELPIAKARFLHQLIEVSPGLREFITDATERPVQRASNQSTQENFYSGKKKSHTVKNGIYVNPRTKKIIAVTDTYLGKTHDRKIMDEDPNMTLIPPGSKGMGDSGYQGVGVDNPRLKFVTPKRKPPGKELSTSQKDTNRQISSIRVKGEHPFAYLKHFNILKYTSRIKFNKLSENDYLKKQDLPFQTLACIYNFSLAYR